MFTTGIIYNTPWHDWDSNKQVNSI